MLNELLSNLTWRWSFIRYSIRGCNCPLEIEENTGQLVLKKELDRESTHLCDVTAQEMSLKGVGKMFSQHLFTLLINNGATSNLDTFTEGLWSNSFWKLRFILYSVTFWGQLSLNNSDQCVHTNIRKILKIYGKRGRC